MTIMGVTKKASKVSLSIIKKLKEYDNKSKKVRNELDRKQ